MFNLTVIDTLGGPNSRAFGIDPFRRVVGAAQAAPSSDYHAMMFSGAIQDISVLPLVNPATPPGAPQFFASKARAISNPPTMNALVVGSSGVFSFAGTALDRAFFWSNHPLPQEIGTLVPVPGFPGIFLGSSQANAANNLGKVVGVSDISTLGANLVPLRRAFIFDVGTNQIQALPTLFPDPNIPGQFLGNCEAKGINDLGQIVGVSDIGLLDASNNIIRHAFLFDPSTNQMHDLGTILTRQGTPVQSGGNSEARAINKFGQIVGVSDTNDVTNTRVQRGFLLTALSGSMRDLGTLNPANQLQANLQNGNSEGNAINNNGVVVGVADTAMVDVDGDPVRHGFMWDPTIHHPEDLNNPPLPSGWTIVEATGINNPIDICGLGVDAAGTERGLILFV